jgi:hypothetical protein
VKLVLIVGASAVGKMTVGQELAKITDLRLFYNHMTIEPVIELFGRFDGAITKKLRGVYYEEFANSGLSGMISTGCFAFDDPADWEYLYWICGYFRAVNADFYCVELIAPQEVRLERNATENRLAYKASKRDLEFSNKLLLRDDGNHRFESFDGELDAIFPPERHLKIYNTDVPPDVAAEMIKKKFALE